MVAFGTQGWLDEYRRRIDAAQTGPDPAPAWEGELACVVEAEPDRGWPCTLSAVLQLRYGRCRQARLVGEAEADAALVCVRAPYRRWKEVVRRELDPLQGMMQGRLRLRGDLPVVVRAVGAVNALVGAAAQVPTEFPDEG